MATAFQCGGRAMIRTKYLSKRGRILRCALLRYDVDTMRALVKHKRWRVWVDDTQFIEGAK